MGSDKMSSAADSSQARERGLKIMAEMLGPERAQQVREAWLELSPDFERYVVEFLAGEVWSRAGLDRKTKSLCTIAALAALGRPQGLELNIRMALRNGASQEEVAETLLHIAPYAGFPACWEGLTALYQVCHEDEA
jgi:alkylhydroperoxidase/carboxymuconolactone decarboxylase family protein YurZ